MEHVSELGGFNMNSWYQFLQSEFEKEYFKDLQVYISEQYNKYTVYPPKTEIFNSFKLCDLNNLKVIILGQDPYHNPGEAHGLSFSVPQGIKIPPSLNNIFKEIKNNYPELIIPKSGNLEHWSKQGILLLNSILTVRKNEPTSHKNRGWEQFTDNIIKKLSDGKNGLIFLLWGNYAKSKSKLIDCEKHYVLKANHPSPFSAYNGFLGCNHFKQVNEILKENGKEEIVWF